jgi:hypothetical protein
MQVRIGAVVVIVMASCMVPGARAESPNPDAIVKPILGDSTGGKSYACFVRRYSAAHLARHPRQNVTEVRLLVTAETVPEDKHLNYSLAVHATVRSKERFETSAGCGHAEMSETQPGTVTIACSVGCEGGGAIAVDLIAAGKPATIHLDGARVAHVGRTDEEANPLDLGGGDGVFHLFRVSLSECRELMPKDEVASNDP